MKFIQKHMVGSVLGYAMIRVRPIKFTQRI